MKLASATVIRVGIVACALFASSQGHTEDKAVKLKFSLFLPAAHPVYKATKQWADSVEKESGGTIKTVIFPAEQLGKAFDQYDMARDGIAEMTLVVPGYQPGRFPVLGLSEMPFALTDAQKGSRAIDAWYRKYAATEMKDTHLCLAFVMQPGIFHSRTKKILEPDDLKGMKIRPSQATVGAMVKLLGGTNVQASMPEARDAIERGVADAVTTSSGSLALFGIEKVTKYHVDIPMFTSAFTYSMNPVFYNSLSPTQKKVIDSHCNTDWAARIASPWADFEKAGHEKLKADSSRDVYKLTPEQLDHWKKAVEPLKEVWAAAVQKTGTDASAAAQDFLSHIQKEGANN